MVLDLDPEGHLTTEPPSKSGSATQVGTAGLLPLFPFFYIISALFAAGRCFVYISNRGCGAYSLLNLSVKDPESDILLNPDPGWCWTRIQLIRIRFRTSTPILACLNPYPDPKHCLIMFQVCGRRRNLYMFALFLVIELSYEPLKKYRAVFMWLAKYIRLIIMKPTGCR